MRVLQSEGVFGKKIAVDSVHNILVNNKNYFVLFLFFIRGFPSSSHQFPACPRSLEHSFCVDLPYKTWVNRLIA